MNIKLRSKTYFIRNFLAINQQLTLIKSGRTFVRVLIISKRAEKRLDNIVQYLSEEWSEKVKSDFLLEFEKIIILLSLNPFMYPLFIEERGIRKCLITKQNAMYYTVSNHIVKIIAMHDTRQNPQSLKL